MITTLWFSCELSFNDSKWIDLCILRNIALTHFLSLFFLPVSLSVLLSLFFPSLFLWLPRESEWVCIWGDSCYRDEEVFLVFCCHGNFGHLISPTHKVEAPHLTILHVLVHTLISLSALTTHPCITPPCIGNIHTQC